MTQVLVRMLRRPISLPFQILSALFIWVGMSVDGLAQSNVRPPDAGALQQQTEHSRPSQAVPHTGLSGWRGLAQSPEVKDNTVVPVQGFKFQGNSLLSDEVLTQLLQDRTRQSLSFLQLQLVAEKVMQAYRDAGWMAYAYLPEQDVTSGVISVHIIEALMGELVLRTDPQQRIDEAHLREIFKAHQIQGEALRIQALDRALLLVSDLPGLSIKGGLSEWSAESPARDVVVEAVSTPLYSGEASMDNAGARSTGRERALTTLNLNSPMGRGDLATFTAVKSEGSTYLRADVSWPVGYKGWRLTLYDAHLSYRIVSPEFLASNAKGTANTLGLAAIYPVLRSPTRNLHANFQVERKGFDNQSNSATESQYKSTAVGASLSGNINDAWDGMTAGSLSWVSGLLNLNGSPTQSRDAAGAQTAGRFDKLRYALSRQQFFSSRLTGYVGLNGQLASKNLDSSEKFILGGESGVRAYPGSEGVGAQGQGINLELRWRASDSGTLMGFYDWGHVTLLRDNTSSTALNAYALKGSGLAWVESLPGGARLKFTWARRMGNNPNPSNTGTDQDGSLITNRYWLSASVPFSF